MGLNIACNLKVHTVLMLVLTGFFCQEPPQKEKTEIEKMQDEAASFRTETALGTISMAVTGVKAGEGVTNPSANVELGIVKIVELGGLVPRRIEFMPLVYNQMQAIDEREVDLDQDQGVGIKISMGNPDREWAIVTKGLVSTDQFAETVPGQEKQGLSGYIGFHRNFGGYDPERLERLRRLRDLPRPMEVFVTNADFDGKIKRKPEDIRLIHRNIMTTYLTAAIEAWLQKQPDIKAASEELKNNSISAPLLYRWLQQRLFTEKPLYINSEDNRQIYIRPQDFKDQKFSEAPKLFDQNEMLYDFVMSLDYSTPGKSTNSTASPALRPID